VCVSILQALDETLLELCETRGLDDGLVDYLDEIVEKARGAESESAKKEVPLTQKPKRAHTHTYTHTLARARTRAQTHAHHTHTERESAKKEVPHTQVEVYAHTYPYHTQISVLARERAHIHAHPDS